MNAFLATDILTSELTARLTEIRIHDPDRPLRASGARKRREEVAPDGRLNLLAADHPARGIVSVAGNPLGMADRQDFLARILRVLSSSLVDGVMATMDVLEDLLTIDDLTREAGSPAILDDKLLVVSVNRGGLAHSAWEMDDPLTGPGAETCAEWRFDGVKMLLRICDQDAGSLKTLVASAQAISAANALGLPTFLEPLPVTRTDQGYKVIKTREALARAVSVASALGDSSRYLWLKLPYCDGYGVVARATTLPILLLGGESSGDPAPFLRELAAALAAAPNVRGALVGRNVLYPGAEDPLAIAEAVGALIHKERRSS